MNEQLISFETAKLAKEKGFTKENGCACRDGWVCYLQSFTGQVYTTNPDEMVMDHLGNSHLIERPTQSLLQKWFREVHNIFLYIVKDDEENISYLINEEYYYDTGPWNGNFNTYEEALEAGLQEAFKHI